ncbi:hypothetical protein ABTZ03_20585 [Kitasatospora sp. NPDC096077]|uniref:hypothetical protein n=1 Tax=Kitasatospora sp. NPDC096077 TaxID=3155544 RepID=UPI003319BC86
MRHWGPDECGSARARALPGSTADRRTGQGTGSGVPASDQASFITGAVLPVDGGYLAQERCRMYR